VLPFFDRTTVLLDDCGPVACLGVNDFVHAKRRLRTMETFFPELESSKQPYQTGGRFGVGSSSGVGAATGNGLTRDCQLKR